MFTAYSFWIALICHLCLCPLVSHLTAPTDVCWPQSCPPADLVASYSAGLRHVLGPAGAGRHTVHHQCPSIESILLPGLPANPITDSGSVTTWPVVTLPRTTGVMENGFGGSDSSPGLSVTKQVKSPTSEASQKDCLRPGDMRASATSAASDPEAAYALFARLPHLLLASGRPLALSNMTTASLAASRDLDHPSEPEPPNNRTSASPVQPPPAATAAMAAAAASAMVMAALSAFRQTTVPPSDDVGTSCPSGRVHSSVSPARSTETGSPTSPSGLDLIWPEKLEVEVNANAGQAEQVTKPPDIASPGSSTTSDLLAKKEDDADDDLDQTIMRRRVAEPDEKICKGQERVACRKVFNRKRQNNSEADKLAPSVLCFGRNGLISTENTLQFEINDPESQTSAPKAAETSFLNHLPSSFSRKRRFLDSLSGSLPSDALFSASLISPSSTSSASPVKRDFSITSLLGEETTNELVSSG